MAKRKKKGSGRGRRGAPIDPATGRFLKIKSASATSATTTVTNAPTEPAAVIAGQTITPEQVQAEVSGFRKALMQTASDLGVDRSEIQDALLDGLRKTAEDIVRQNKEIFGEKLEKTVDQSAAYEIFDKVVRLSEEAATAKTVEQKQKILQRLQTYKKVAQNVFKGGGKQAEVARALIDMIEKIEKPLSKETGIRAVAKEKISDYAKMLPEKMAIKIPIIGGMLSRSLQRRRERKEEEAEALATLTEEISRAGRTSLYGKGGRVEIGATPTSADMSEVEPPIPGGTPLSQINDVPRTQFDADAVMTLRAILLNVKEIRDLMFEQYDPAKEELEKEESAREEENRKQSFLKRLLSGKSKSGGATPAAEGEGGGMVSSILKFLGMEGLGTTLMSAITGTLTPILTSLGAAIGSLATTIGTAVASAATAVGGAAMAAAPWVAAAGAGTAIGLGAAWLINKGIDTMFGTDLSDRMFDPDTWTFRDMIRDREREEEGKKIAKDQERQRSTPEYIQRMSQDPRMLPKLVSDKKLTKTEALSILSTYERQYGAGEDTERIRQRILQTESKTQSQSVQPQTNGSNTNPDIVVPQAAQGGLPTPQTNGGDTTIQTNGSNTNPDIVVPQAAQGGLSILQTNGGDTTIQTNGDNTKQGGLSILQTNGGDTTIQTNGDNTTLQNISPKDTIQTDEKNQASILESSVETGNTTVQKTVISGSKSAKQISEHLIREKILMSESAISSSPDSSTSTSLLIEKDGIPQGTIVTPTEKNITQQTLNMLEQSQDALAVETMGPPSPVGVNTVVAPTTNNTSTTINNNSGNTGVRNNDPTLKAAERASL